jgi:hypothetical protein
MPVPVSPLFFSGVSNVFRGQYGGVIKSYKKYKETTKTKIIALLSIGLDIGVKKC